MKISRQKRARITAIIEAFITRVHELINLPVGEVIVNPFLAAALGLKKKSEILEFFLMQRLQRGIVTSFGSVIQEIAKTLDSEAHEEDVDLVFERNGKKHYVQLKSGPEGFTRPALRKTRAAFQKLKTRDPSCVTVIGFSYGTKDQLSPVWGREVYERGIPGTGYFNSNWCILSPEFPEFPEEALVGYYKTGHIEGVGLAHG